MTENQPLTQSSTTSSATQAVDSSDQTAAPVAKTPKEMIMLGINEIFGKLKKLSPKASVGTPNIKVNTNLFATHKKKIYIALGAIVFLFAFIWVLRFIGSFYKAPQVVVPTPSPSPTPILVTPTPSKYATDSAVLKIEGDINTLDQELSNVEIDESAIRPRPLNWNVNFK